MIATYGQQHPENTTCTKCLKPCIDYLGICRWCQPDAKPLLPRSRLRAGRESVRVVRVVRVSEVA